MADVIGECAYPRLTPSEFLKSIDAIPLGIVIERIAAPLIEHVRVLAGFDKKPSAQTHAPDAEQVTIAEYHASLFRIATGWLGWTPAQAWESTRAEITEAYKGRRELLGVMFGTGNTTEITKADSKTRQRLSALGDLTVMSMSQVPS